MSNLIPYDEIMNKPCKVVNYANWDNYNHCDCGDYEDDITESNNGGSIPISPNCDYNTTVEPRSIEIMIVGGGVSGASLPYGTLFNVPVMMELRYPGPLDNWDCIVLPASMESFFTGQYNYGVISFNWALRYIDIRVSFPGFQNVTARYCIDLLNHNSLLIGAYGLVYWAAGDQSVPYDVDEVLNKFIVPGIPNGTPAVDVNQYALYHENYKQVPLVSCKRD